MKVLVISPHPDDETLGAGGTLLKHRENRDEIFWCNVTDMKVEYGFSADRVQQREEEIQKVIKLYQFKEFFNISLPPAKLNDNLLDNLIAHFCNVIEKIKPNILYIPFDKDPHSDHRVVFKALLPFMKSFRYPYIKQIFSMEIISETDNQFIAPFFPNYFVDISDFLDKKLEILSIYESEIDYHPFPRSLENIKALATFRGAQINAKYAEAFKVIKYIA